MGKTDLLYRFDNCVLDTSRRELRRGQIIYPVEPQVFDLLRFLIENRHRVVSRDEIFQVIWRGRIVSESTLATRINAARAAIGDDGTQQRLIRTLRRTGLRFVGEAHGDESPAAPLKAHIFSPKRRLALVLNDAPAIVISPFKYSGEVGKVAAFAEGLTDEVTCTLYQLDWLLVISRHSSFAYQGMADHAVVKKLGTQYLLQISIRADRNVARVTVRLVDNAGNHLWAESFDCDLDSALQSQIEIGDKVVSAVSNYIFAAESFRTQQKLPRVSTSWESVIGAVTLISSRKKLQVAAARALLNRVIATDPKCVPALALLSFTFTLGAHLGWYSRKLIQPSALDAAERALSLDCENAWAHLALGYAKLHLTNRPDEAIDILQNALTLNPNLAMTHYFIALASSYLGRSKDAFEHADLAERVQPYDLLSRGNPGALNTVRATASFVAGRYADGISFAKRAIVQNPGQVPAYRQIVTNSAMAGETNHAEAALKTIERLTSNVQRFIDESQDIWAHNDNYRRYAESFRMAGLKST